MEQLHKSIDNYSSSGFGSSATLGATSRVDRQNTARLTATCKQIISTVLGDYQGSVAIQLWDGSWAFGDSSASCVVVFNDPGVIREIILYRSLSRLTEAYLDGAAIINGNMESLFDLGPYLESLRLSWGTQLRLLYLALTLPSLKNSKKHSEKSSENSVAATTHENGQASIAHHYDVSNKFYRLWLDPQMVYSCAYFRDEQQSLAQAQQDKLDYLCRKLRLQAGQSLLDIGCGWGALAIHAARHYDVTVHGITLSKAQQRIAVKRVKEEGLEDKVTIELRDYRDLPENVNYDRVVSVGMFEHVGIKNFPVYFGTVKRVLKPGGLFLNHGITSEQRWSNTPVNRFINRYIFPDGELTRVSEVLDAMEKAGFEILDTEGLRRHYAFTLRHWVKALEENYKHAVKQTSEATYRLWRLYMAGSAYFFEEGSIGVHQLLVGHRHAPLAIPLRRDDLYTQQDKQ